MPINVQAENKEDHSAQTPLFSLKQRREEIAKALTIDLKIPRWDSPELFVRYHPIDNGELQEKIAKREGQRPRPKDWSTLTNADILISCCEGVYACLGSDYEEKFSLRLDDPNGPWTKFDGELAVAIGLPVDAKATQIVRAVYLTDGDLIDAANKLLEFSGQSNEEINKDF